MIQNNLQANFTGYFAKYQRSWNCKIYNSNYIQIKNWLKVFFKCLAIIFICATMILGCRWYSRHPDRDHRVRSYAYLLNRYIFQKEYLIANSIYGTLFKFKSADVVGRSIYKGKNYEPDLTKFVLEKISYDVGDLILDVGANLGWYSINISKYYPNKNIKIFAFEPDNINFDLLNENVELNNIQNIVTINKAVADKSGQETLYKYPDKNLGRHSLFKDDTLKQQQIVVNTISIDQFINFEHLIGKKIKLLKIDIEGYEYQALLGCIKTLPNISYILHEFSPQIMKRNNIDPVNLINLLLKNNFKPFIIVDRGNHLKALNQQDLLCLSEGANLLWQNNQINQQNS